MAKKSEEMEPSLDYEQLFSIQTELTPTGLLPLDTVLGGGYEPGDVIAITSEPGVGKALSMDATLYTESGPIKMRDVKVGDKIADPDGKFSEVLGVYPQGVKNMYKFTMSDGTEVKCSHDHLWTVKQGTSEDYEVLTAEQIHEGLKASGTFFLPEVSPVDFTSDVDYSEEYLEQVARDMIIEDLIDIPKGILYSNCRARTSFFFKLVERLFPKLSFSENVYEVEVVIPGLYFLKELEELAKSLGCVCSRNLKDGYVDTLSISLSHSLGEYLKTQNPCYFIKVDTKPNEKKVRFIAESEAIEAEECQCIRVDNDSHLFLTDGFTPTHNTTMFLTLAKNFIQQGHRVAYFDVEKGVKMGILRNFGLDDVTGCDIAKSPFFLIKPDTYTTMEKAFRDCVNFGIKYIFIDSMTALVDSTYIDELVSDKITIGSSARVETQLYPVLKGLAKMNEVTVFIVQQMRVKMEAKGMRMNVSKDSGGGYAAKHTPDVRLFLDKGPKYIDERVGFNGDKEKVEYGNEARLYAEKNRNAPPFVKVPCPIIYGHGMKNSLYVELILRSHGAIRSGGPYYKVSLYPDKEPVSLQGKSNLAKWISDNLDECIKVIKENGWSEIKSVQVD